LVNKWGAIVTHLKQWTLAILAFLNFGSCVVDNSPIRIMPMGDSITFGINYPGAYRIKLEKLLVTTGNSFQFVGSMSNGPNELISKSNEGHSGWETNQLLAQAADWVSKYQPDIVLLMTGTNDVAMDEISQVPDIARIKREIEQLVEAIFQVRPQVRIVLSTIPPTNGFWNSYAQQLNTEIRNIVTQKAANGQAIKLADSAAILTTSDMDPVDLPIYVHPSATGYDKIADVFFSAISL
jgi:lysophospholipase L1-like esterase